MKTTFYAIVLIIIHLILIQFCFAQDKAVLVQLSPEIGDTIDLSERNYYDLFPVIKDFHYAVFFLINDTTSELRIWYLKDEGSLMDTVITNSAESIGNYKAYIRQIDNERLKNFEYDIKIKVVNMGGDAFDGKLLSVQSNSIIICPDSVTSPNTLSFINSYTKLNVNEFDTVHIELNYWSKVGIWTGVGSLVGFLAGMAIGATTPIDKPEIPNSYYWSDLEKLDNASKGMVIGLLVGASAGLVVGLLTSSSEETIEINSAADLELLRDYLIQ